nr:hypothetical protein [Bacilli bacterium]
SENYMFRKFMIDSAKFWATEYKLGGFRFDLMGLHDLTTMNTLTAAVKEATFDNFTIYGEPWTGGSTPLTDGAVQDSISKYEGYGAFNDLMRDALIKGGLNPTSAHGWAMVSGTDKVAAADAKAIVNGIKGWTSNGTATKSKDPNKAVQYASCHDNYTLFDRMTVGYSKDGGKTTTAPSDLLHYGPTLANGLALLSSGTSFMLGGEEFLRTKTKEDGTKDGNSYNASYEENAFDYALLMENQDVYSFYKNLIAHKVGNGALQQDETGASALSVEALNDNNVITYTYGNYTVYARNGLDLDDATVDLNGRVAFTNYGEASTSGNKLTLRPYEFVVIANS